jgi:hypothetical protein
MFKLMKTALAAAAARVGTARSGLLLAALMLLPVFALADSWRAPTPSISHSRSGNYRVTITPKPWGAEAARPGARDAAHARVERFESDHFVDDWEQPLVNELMPVEALIPDDGAYLVTFDNWGRVGVGDDVVVIYRRGGALVRKLALEEILPEAYIRHLPSTVSSVWWGGVHELVEGDKVLELHVLEPGAAQFANTERVPVRIRLSDGALIPPSGPAWQRAMAKIAELEKTPSH